MKPSFRCRETQTFSSHPVLPVLSPDTPGGTSSSFQPHTPTAPATSSPTTLNPTPTVTSFPGSSPRPPTSTFFNPLPSIPGLQNSVSLHLAPATLPPPNDRLGPLLRRVVLSLLKVPLRTAVGPTRGLRGRRGAHYSPSLSAETCKEGKMSVRSRSRRTPPVRRRGRPPSTYLPYPYVPSPDDLPPRDLSLRSPVICHSGSFFESTLVGDDPGSQSPTVFNSPEVSTEPEQGSVTLVLSRLRSLNGSIGSTSRPLRGPTGGHRSGG